MKKVILFLSLIAISISCKKDNDTVTPAEQAVIDDERIIDFLKTSKLEDFHVGEMPNNIDWKIVTIAEDEEGDVETLYDIMSENVIDTTYNGVDYKIYYYFVDEGKGGESPSGNDLVRVDYKGFNLGSNTPFDYSLFSPLNFDLSLLIGGWQFALPYFKTGVKPEGFPLDFEYDPYREQIDTPGRGFIIFPSALAYGNVARFDIVLYEKETQEEEE